MVTICDLDTRFLVAICDLDTRFLVLYCSTFQNRNNLVTCLFPYRYSKFHILLMLYEIY